MVFMLAIPAAIIGGAFWYNQSLKGENLSRFDAPKPVPTHPRETPSKGMAAVEKILDENFTRPVLAANGRKPKGLTHTPAYYISMAGPSLSAAPAATAR